VFSGKFEVATVSPMADRSHLCLALKGPGEVRFDAVALGPAGLAGEGQAGESGTPVRIEQRIQVAYDRAERMAGPASCSASRARTERC
jgi:hypothetical protein